MSSTQPVASTTNRDLNARIRSLRELDDHTNVLHLAREYLTALAIVASTIAFLEFREGFGIHPIWRLPVVGLAMALIGAVQHRLAGLGHEASHYILFKGRVRNELLSDLLCMFPIFATTQQYRLVHFAHHQYTNDWDRDPDLMNIGRHKLMHCFPMTRKQFVYNYFVRFLWPPTLLAYLWDVLRLSALGSGASPYVHGVETEGDGARRRGIPFATILGIFYVAAMIFGLALTSRSGSGSLLAFVPVAAWLSASGVLRLLPDRAFFDSPIKPVYSKRWSAVARLTWFTLLLAGFAWLRLATGRNWGGYFLLLWVTPLLTSFPYFMLLRDVYQHANADADRLTNSRVFFCDPFTRWSVFVYGMDIHVPHHLYPAIPHYNLPKLHQLLKEHHGEYAERVVECHGTFLNGSGKPTILDVMRGPRVELSPIASTWLARDELHGSQAAR